MFLGPPNVKVGTQGVGFWWILEKASLNVQSLPWAPTVTEKCVLAVGLTYQDNGGGKMLLGPLGGSHVRKHRFHLFLRPPTQELGTADEEAQIAALAI